MTAALLGLGWWVRRSADPLARRAFYSTVIGLPELRYRNTDTRTDAMMWAGGVACLEVSVGPGPGPQAASPDLDGLAPVFRVRDFAPVLKRLSDAGVAVHERTESDGVREVWCRDPDGFPIGFRAAQDGAPTPADQMAARDWRNRPWAAAGLPDLADGLQDVARVRLRVSDVGEAVNFYREALGLTEAEYHGEAEALLHLGGTTLLDIRSGGSRRAPPADRSDAGDVWILRTTDHAGVKSKLAARNAHVVNEMELLGGWLDYVADPDGTVFGYQERKPPTGEDTGRPRIEDDYVRTRFIDGP